MSQLNFVQIAPGSITTPVGGNTAVFTDTDKILKTMDSTAFRRSYFNNFSTSQQSFTASTRTYLTGSAVALAAAGRMQIGSMFRWRFDLAKTTNAGVAATVIDIAVGTAGTTSDTARVSFTLPVSTANIDVGFIEIDCICRGPLSSSGIFAGNLSVTHNLQTTGIMNQASFAKNVISGTFDVTLASFVGICITTGASDVDVVDMVQTEAWNI